MTAIVSPNLNQVIIINTATRNRVLQSKLKYSYLENRPDQSYTKAIREKNLSLYCFPVTISMETDIRRVHVIARFRWHCKNLQEGRVFSWVQMSFKAFNGHAGVYFTLNAQHEQMDLVNNNKANTTYTVKYHNPDTWLVNVQVKDGCLSSRMNRMYVLLQCTMFE